VFRSEKGQSTLAYIWRKTLIDLHGGEKRGGLVRNKKRVDEMQSGKVEGEEKTKSRSTCMKEGCGLGTGGDLDIKQ